MPNADVVFTGGAVFSAGLPASVAADVAVLDGRIVAVGPSPELRDWIGDGTTLVDTSGRLLVPGFQDAHVHPIGAGVEILQCDLTGASDAADCLRMIAEYAAANPDEPWIRGGGWSMEFFPGGTPTAADLDAVVADRPVLLSNRDHHGAWANSLALSVAGITAETPDPADGRIERDAAGSPAGTLHEGAVALVEAHAPDVDPDLAYRGLLRAQEALLAQGVTGWQDAMVGEVLGLPDTLDVYLRAVADGTLIARVVAALWWERDRDTGQLDEMSRRRDQVAALGVPERLRADSVKIMVDGVAENFTAAMNTPYRDAHGHPTANTGHSFLTTQALNAAVLEADAAGFQVHFHALGNRAVREALDALEALPSRADDASPRRHHLAHLQIVDEVEVARFAELGAAANLQALWACHEPQLDELALPFLDADLEARHYPFGELAGAGVLLGAGSDWPVSTADPLAAVHVAVNRVGPGSDAAPLGAPEQRLDLATALTAYTAGSAWINGRDESTGRIEPGRLADLVVLDRDPFSGPATEIADTRVLSTWVDGVQVYSAD
ncbi:MULTISPECIES: amidohydrolase [unclassified Leifsonia]|uniref:amidohydrolase n=1 Tax=unclassified Leifsonia TaxID=2663824 RepID=UPI0006FFAAD1|nr:MULTISPECIES: amidohydrolase [unclassified Leifsonia]KQX05437.1 amidohydrolase [Leifsonia sp. Root1293]KRA09070.1 amidohydrolase [Leifsonia sp. Root60]